MSLGAPPGSSDPDGGMMLDDNLIEVPMVQIKQTIRTLFNRSIQILETYESITIPQNPNRSNQVSG